MTAALDRLRVRESDEDFTRQWIPERQVFVFRDLQTMDAYERTREQVDTAGLSGICAELRQIRRDKRRVPRVQTTPTHKDAPP